MAILLIILTIIIFVGLSALLVISACMGASHATQKEETISTIATKPSQQSRASDVHSPQDQRVSLQRPLGNF